jgi:DNA-binding MarR family transcriptional regulator
LITLRQNEFSYIIKILYNQGNVKGIATPIGCVALLQMGLAQRKTYLACKIKPNHATHSGKPVTMTNSKTELKKRALAAVRDYGVNLTLFRNAVSEWAGLNVTDMECLRLLFLKGTASPSELAKHTGLTSGATTAMLDRLENAGLIERRPNPNDRRGTLIAAAESSAEKAASWFASARKAQDDLISSYSAEELEIISDVFERFTKLWDAESKKLTK